MDNTVPGEADESVDLGETTSPSQLQEVTLGINGTSADQTKISPMRGRSVKEYDEQLTALKKENFNLKLRIYFLEERMGSTFRLEDKDNIIRKNIEFKVEIETLRKELDEKQDLLCQAVKALELEDEEHKRVLAIKDSQLYELNERIGDLENEMKSLSDNNSELLANQEQMMNNSTQMYTQAFGLQSENTRSKAEIEQLQEHITDLETQLAEERDHSTLLENEVREADCLQSRCTNLQTELEERNDKLKELVIELEQNGHTLSSYSLRIRTLEDALISTNSDLSFKTDELAHRDKVIQEQSAEIEELRRLVEESHVLCDKEQRQTENLKNAVMSRDNTIADLESRLEKSKSVIRNLEAKLDSISHENKRQHDEIQTMKQQRRSRVNDSTDSKISPRKVTISRPNSSNSNSVYADVELLNVEQQKETVTVLKDEMKQKEYKLSELEKEQLKAYNLIQQFITKTKSLEKEVAGMKVNLSKKNKQIEELQSSYGGRFNGDTGVKGTSLPSQFSGPRGEDKENSVEDSDEDKTTAEKMSKSAAGDTTAMEWEKHVEDLVAIIEEKEQELEQLKEQNEFTKSTLKHKDNRIVELEKEVEDFRSELCEVNTKLEELSSEKLDNSTEKPVSWLRVTEEKDKKIEQLESEVRKHTFNLQGIVNTELWDKNREIEKLQNRFTEKLRVKEQEITQLEKDITVKDSQLTMLKDKISELGVQVNLSSASLTARSNSVNNAAESLEEPMVLKEQLRISNDERKFLHQTVEELRQQLKNTPERDSDNKIVQLKHKYSKLQLEYEKSEKLRLETANLCTLLTTRLEELAHFLDSLLKLKSVLGLLGSKQRSAIKQAIDQSLDLSKSLSVSMMNEDQSLAQLSSISGLLNTTQTSMNMSIFDPWQGDELVQQKANISLTYNSHLSRQKGELMQNDVVAEQAEIIKVLRAQIETMKKEIEIRDMELNKQNMEHLLSSDTQELKNDHDLVEALIDLQHKSSLSRRTVDILSPNKIYQNLLADKSGSSMKNHLVDNQSESEAWSEPDRCVSQARIGLDAEVLKNNSTPNLNRSRSNKSASVEGTTTSESTGDELSKSHSNRTPSKRGSGSIESRHTVNILQDNLLIMENKLKEKENEILTLKTNVMQLTNKTLEVKLHMAEEIAKMRNEKIDMEKLLKEMEEKVKIEPDNEAILKLENAYQEKEDALVDTQLQLEALKAKLILLEQTLHEKEKEFTEQVQEKETQCQEKHEENEEKWKTLMENVERGAEQQLLEMHQTMEELKEKYETEYIQKTELNKHIEEMQVLFDELKQLKEVLKLTESKIKYMEENEMTLKKQMEVCEETHREKINALKREINEATLRTSQAVLERTKVSNEKLKLEAEMRKLESINTDKAKELDEKSKELINMRNNLQKQLSQVEQQKSCLQLKVSELETLNADLHNRLVKLQTRGSNENVWTTSRSTSPPKISELLANYKVFGKHSLGGRLTFTRQKSDMSGYASEDVLTDDNDAGGVFNRSAPETFQWFNQANANVPIVVDVADVRNVANSSPDLGIESDQGRFSSLETNVATRPLLQTLELTASMNNLLSADQLDNVGHYCNIIAHKILEKENGDLRKTVSKLEAGLERTRSQLSVINQNKRQVEKAVCKQIHKTSIVLRQARANLDSGSENETTKRK